MFSAKLEVLKWHHNHFQSPVFGLGVLYPTGSEIWCFWFIKPQGREIAIEIYFLLFLSVHCSDFIEQIKKLVIYTLSVHLCHATYCVQEINSKLKLFYWLFIELFCHYFLALGLNTRLNTVWKYCYIYQSDLTPFKCWSGFHFFLGLLASFFACAINTDIWQAMIARAIESKKNCSKPP